LPDFPEIDEILVAIVKKILPYGAFCSLPEYKTEAFLHISQVSNGWVKNIHEFISEGQTIVVKVSHIDPDKNQIDISLKSVTEDEKRKKTDSIKRATRGQKLLEFAIKNSKSKETFEEVKNKIEKEFEDVLSMFEECHEDEKIIAELEIPKKLKDEIIKVSKTSIKKSEFIIEGTALLSCYSADGVEKIKEILSLENPNLNIHYLGAPRYKMSFKCKDYKQGEKELSKLISKIEKKAEESACSFEFKRE
jgi:translation initiation factor 2 subunit 1